MKFINIAYELHGYGLSPDAHYMGHFGNATTVQSGLSASDSGSDTLIITQGKLFDEDIVVQILNGTVGSAKFTQVLNELEAYKYYRLGASEIYKDNLDTDVALLSAGVPQLNPFDGSAYSLTPMTNNRYGAMWVVYTSDVNTPVQLWVGQAESDQLNDAIEVNGLDSMNFGSIPVAEIRAAYRVIIKYSGGSVSIEQIDNFLTDPSTGTPQTPSNVHGALLGLADDDHTQYQTEARAKTYGDTQWVEQDLDEYTQDLSLAGTEKVYIEDGTTPKNTTVNAFATYIGGLSGTVINTGKYYDTGLGSHDTAFIKTFELSNTTNADVYSDIIDTTKITDFYTVSGIDKVLRIKLPSSLDDDTADLRLSIDNGTTYDDILLANITTAGDAFLSEELYVKYTLDGWVILDDVSLTKELGYTGAIGQHTVPKNGVATAITKRTLSEIKQYKGMTTEWLLDNGGSGLSYTPGGIGNRIMIDL